MNVCKSEIALLVLIALSFLISLVFYPSAPDKIATHWNAKGNVDGYMGKFWGTFTMPLILVGITLLFLAIPRIDPLKANIEKFRNYYDGMVIIISVFLILTHLWVILWNLGFQIPSNLTLSIGLGLLIIYLGILCKHSKRNWFIGIRTPWTLSSDSVWEKTHKIGGNLFILAGFITLFGLFFDEWAIYFLIVPIIIVSIYTIIYSYVEYQKEKTS
ncbi:SdpI family protein [bacterium]|nr:SdpI family protein [bacterium]